MKIKHLTIHLYLTPGRPGPTAAGLTGTGDTKLDCLAFLGSSYLHPQPHSQSKELFLAGTSYGSAPSCRCLGVLACWDLHPFCCQGMRAPEVWTPTAAPSTPLVWGITPQKGCSGKGPPEVILGLRSPAFTLFAHLL